MNRILKETHKASNIKLLKVRDYYFDIARRYNSIRMLFVCLPPILLAITYIPALSEIGWIDEGRDIIVGFVSIAAFIMIHFIFERIIQKNLYISNAFREKYDCNVFGIEENPVAYNLDDMEQHLDKARFVKDFSKYEVWYGEAFCGNNARNVLCCQMDNIIYTYYVYSDYKKILLFIPILTYILIFASLFFGFKVFLLIFMSVFNILQFYIEIKDNVEDLIETNQNIMKIVEDDKDELLPKLDRNGNSVIRMIQDVVISIRNQSLFIPKFIRNRYLKEGNPFYRALDKYKAMYLEKESITIPESADDLEIFDLAETKTITLTQIQQRLTEMMTKVNRVFEEENITYTLDGGTLIGAVRVGDLKSPIEQVPTKGGDFVFWDDDIDIAIPLKDGMLERAKKAIREKLGDEFDVQDYENDRFYSPRLSNFRIRDKKSIISEKDSQLYDKYQSRGLFIDVYAYMPILHSLSVDKAYRRMFIHPLYKKLKKTEDLYPQYSRSTKEKDKKKLEKLLLKFDRQKARYMKRVDWYISHAKNDSYRAYTPNYIHDLDNPGPYIPKDYLEVNASRAQFNRLDLPIPADPDKVLTAFYGKWYISPYKSIDMLKEERSQQRESDNDNQNQIPSEDKWFSLHKFRVSVMKHIDHVDLDD